MPTYQLTVEYDGTDFHGWQVQPRERTAAGTLLDALQVVSGERPRMSAAGRIDSGAHAHGQVAGVTLQRDWDPERLSAALNVALPADIAVVDAALRSDSFDARRDARDRTYRYLLVAARERAPVVRRHAWTVPGALDLGGMRRAAAHLVGRHDFAAFGAAPHPDGTTVRLVHDVSVTAHSAGDGARLDLVVIAVRANAFLRGMMRAFAGALTRVGQSRASVEWLAGLVDSTAEQRAGVHVAPARGLHQWRVTYGEEVQAA